MRTRGLKYLCAGFFLGSSLLWAAVTARVQGVVHDPEHRPLPYASVKVESRTSGVVLAAQTNDAGEFNFAAVPLGDYVVHVVAPGFDTAEEFITVQSGASSVLHIQLAISRVQQTVVVTGAPVSANTVTSTLAQEVTRTQIQHIAGADRTNSLQMITDFVPGAVVVHDQLHMRGGHQVTWAIDGVPLPNTNIATNAGPQFDPKDIDTLEIQRSGFGADYGDRTYGVLNVNTRSGFERNREAELVASYGNYNQTDDQLSFGDHTDRFAYYISANGNRSDYGLEPPTAANFHNHESGGGVFTSLIFNQTPKDQLRFHGAARADFYQVPNSPEQELAGTSDRDREQDAFGIFSWVHTFSEKAMSTFSPFYHFNRAAYVGGPSDVPSTTDDRASNYAGGQAEVNDVLRKQNLTGGIYAFAQQDNTLFQVYSNNGTGRNLSQRVRPSGQNEALYAEDEYRVTNWFHLSGGLRYTHFDGNVTENATDPRLGAALQIPGIHVVARGSYGRYYQAPPLDTVSGTLLQFTNANGLAFLPLYGERDELWDTGLTMAARNWVVDLDYFHNAARNYFDHFQIGNSNIYLPLTIAHARIQGYEATVRSPSYWHRLHAMLNYSSQRAQGFGAVTGGITDFSPPEGGFYLDHDQRNTVTAGVNGNLPRGVFASLNFTYGSGFLNGDGPSHLPSYRLFDLSAGKSFGQHFEASLWSTNILDKSYQLDLSSTFGGSHYGAPRMAGGEIRYRFHF